MSEWRFTVNMQPMATPRPSFRYNSNNKQTITYYDERYVKYMYEIKDMLIKNQAYNEDFYEVMRSEMGVKAEVYFYLQVPKGQKRINNIMRTTAPDIDNLLKAIFDSIFKDLEIKDSRIALVTTGKFQVLENPRTEIILRGIE